MKLLLYKIYWANKSVTSSSMIQLYVYKNLRTYYRLLHNFKFHWIFVYDDLKIKNNKMSKKKKKELKLEEKQSQISIYFGTLR